jgi:hypothetical protein
MPVSGTVVTAFRCDNKRPGGVPLRRSVACDRDVIGCRCLSSPREMPSVMAAVNGGGLSVDFSGLRWIVIIFQHFENDKKYICCIRGIVSNINSM